MDQFSLNKKQVLLIILLLFLMAAVPVTIYLSRQTQIFRPKADVGDSCTMNLSDGQTISGFNVQFTATAQRTNPLSYLSVWIIDSSKQGGSFQVGSTQTNTLNSSINSAAIFNNGPGIIECRLQTNQDGGQVVASNRVTVNVSNTDIGYTPARNTLCGSKVTGPAIVHPGEQVTLTYTQPLNIYAWRNYISNPYDYTNASNTYTFTAPSYTGYFPHAILFSVSGFCFRDLTVSNDSAGTLDGNNSWIQCAQEGEICQLNGSGTVRYGRDPVWYTKNNVSGGIACNSQTFGYVNVNEATDPNALKVKHCEYLYQGGPLPLPSESTGLLINSPAPLPSSTTISNTPGCVQTQGDANGDGQATGVDFSMWTTEFLNGSVNRADFNCDGRVNGIDFTIWSNAYLSQNR